MSRDAGENYTLMSIDEVLLKIPVRVLRTWDPNNPIHLVTCPCQNIIKLVKKILLGKILWYKFKHEHEQFYK
jgi:hypothetical protein